jgi:hypothetical protein
MASVIERAASNVVEEAVDEVFGQSKRNWALVLLAFIFGAVAMAVVVIRYREHLGGATGGPDADTALTPGSRGSEAQPAEASKTSRWSRRRAQIAHTDAAMRGRVGSAASRLRIPRHAPNG